MSTDPGNLDVTTGAGSALPSFTPAPWRAIAHLGIVTRDATAPYPADPTGGVEICRVGNWRDRELVPYNGDRWKADANLIAAALDLLEAARAQRALTARVMKALMATGWRDDLLLADEVHRADAATREAITKALGNAAQPAQVENPGPGITND